MDGMKLMRLVQQLQAMAMEAMEENEKAHIRSMNAANEMLAGFKRNLEQGAGSQPDPMADWSDEDRERGYRWQQIKPYVAQVAVQTAKETAPRPVHGDAIAKARRSGKLLATEKKRKGKRHRRTPEDVQDTGQDILDYVREFPGQRGEQITTALGMSAKEMRKPMLALIAARKVSTKGQRRGMVYTATKKGAK